MVTTIFYSYNFFSLCSLSFFRYDIDKVNEQKKNTRAHTQCGDVVWTLQKQEVTRVVRQRKVVAKLQLLCGGVLFLSRTKPIARNFIPIRTHTIGVVGMNSIHVVCILYIYALGPEQIWYAMTSNCNNTKRSSTSTIFCWKPVGCPFSLNRAYNIYIYMPLPYVLWWPV